jgi:hypothetical protein
VAPEARDQQSMGVPIRSRKLREGKAFIRNERRSNIRSSSGENPVTAASQPEGERFEGAGPPLPQREIMPIQNAQERPAENQMDENSETAKPGSLTIKLVTDDPEVVIVWLVDPDKGERQ